MTTSPAARGGWSDDLARHGGTVPPAGSTLGVSSHLTLPVGDSVVLRRLARARRPRVTTESQPDDLPKRGLFAEPVRVTRLVALDADEDDDGVARAVFMLEVKDAEARRCSDISVEAHLTGPERSRTVQGTTDMMGRIRFRMASGPGRYHLRVTDVAARGLDWDATAGPTEIAADVP